MPDPNNLILTESKICFQLICKAGNTSVKWCMIDSLLSDKPTSVHREVARNPALAWQFSHIDNVPPDYFIVGFCRHPVDRLVSCWADKICRNLHVGFERRHPGMFFKGMTFEGFVDKVCSIPDSPEADQHFRSQTFDLDLGRVDLLVRLESFAVGWERVRRECAKRGLELKPIQHKNQTGASKPRVSRETLGRIRERFSNDFRLLGYD